MNLYYKNISKVTAGGRHAWVRSWSGALYRKPLAAVGNLRFEEPPVPVEVSPEKEAAPVYPFRVRLTTKPRPELGLWQVGIRVRENASRFRGWPELTIFCFNLHKKPTEGYIATRGEHYRGFLWSWTWGGDIILRAYRNPLRRWGIGPSVVVLPISIKF